MKIFVLVIVGAILLGGFAGGELVDRTFSVLWATVTGVGTFAMLIGLGAFFHHQDEKKKAKTLPPEMRDVFDRITGKRPYGDDKTGNLYKKQLLGTMLNLMEEDRQQITSGRVPDRRLIPHHAIKRDIILAAFYRDFSNIPASLQKLNKDGFDEKISEIKRWGPEELDFMIETMKRERPDLQELEVEIRANNSLYRLVEPLFPEE